MEIRKYAIQSSGRRIASRGVSAESLQRWIHGPEFLSQSTETWPQRPVDMNATIPADDPEVKKDSMVCMSEASTRDPVSEIIERFSSWTHLKKIVAWILRYKSTLYRLSKERRRGVTSQIQPTGTTTPISIAELNNAELEILKYVQSRCFKEELGCLKQADNQATSSRHNVLKKSSNISKLDPVLSQGLIRVGGRLQRAPNQHRCKASSYPAKETSRGQAPYPILPPRRWTFGPGIYFIAY